MPTIWQTTYFCQTKEGSIWSENTINATIHNDSYETIIAIHNESIKSTLPLVSHAYTRKQLSCPLCVKGFSRFKQTQHLASNCPSHFQLVNNGPSVVSQSTLEVRCPLRAPGLALLYPVEVLTEGPLSCSSKTNFNALKLKVRPLPSFLFLCLDI